MNSLLILGFNTEGCGLQEAESASLDQTRSADGQKSTKNEGVDRLSEQQCQKFDVILMIYARGFGLCPLLEIILYRLLFFGLLWGQAGCPLSGVERCPLLGGSECTICMGRAIGDTVFVRCTEVVRLSESPLLEVSLYLQYLLLI